MMKSFTQTCLSGASDYATVIELGFVPSRVTVTNRTELNKVIWTADTDTKGYFITDQGVTTFVSAVALTLIDGSDKVNYTTSSFGFLLPKITDLNDTAGEILDITAERSDI
jgi:hypothetical protein